MKRILHIIIKTAAMAAVTLPLFLFSAACERNTDQELFSVVTINVSLRDGEKISSMRIDMSQPGNYFQDLNTLQNYEFPSFIDGQGSIKVLKGVYIYAFDASAQLESGEWISVRCAGHNAPATAVSVIEDEVTLDIELTRL